MKEKEEILEIVKKYNGIRLLILFGSRARNEMTADSDWDFAYVGDPLFDSDAFYLDLVLLLRTEKIDLVNLAKANGLLRFRIARDGVLFYQTAEEYERFWCDAVHFWCDAGPLIRVEYEGFLQR